MLISLCNENTIHIHSCTKMKDMLKSIKGPCQANDNSFKVH